METVNKRRSVTEYIKDNRITVIVVSAIVAVIIVLSIVFGVILSNIFRIGRIDRISIAYSDKAKVEEILGKPTVKRMSVWEYYESSVESEIIELNAAVEKGDLEEADRLTKKIRSEKFDYICVTFDESGNAIRVLYDAACRYDGTLIHGEKKVKEYSLEPGKKYGRDFDKFEFVKKVVGETVTYTPVKSLDNEWFVYSTEFSDGSYIKAIAEVKFEVIDNKPYFTWSDAFATYKDSSLIEIIKE